MCRVKTEEAQKFDSLRRILAPSLRSRWITHTRFDYERTGSAGSCSLWAKDLMAASVGLSFMFTNTSTMDALGWGQRDCCNSCYGGHKAVAITDYGNVQSFHIHKAAKSGNPLTHGMEANIVEDRLIVHNEAGDGLARSKSYVSLMENDGTFSHL